MVTRAMTASTIMEAFVEDERVVVELEVGAERRGGLRELIAAASSAPSLPAPIPADAGLSSLAPTAARLKGTVDELARRKRIERDEVSGEPLPNDGRPKTSSSSSSDYPLRTQPKELVFEPPLNDDGYAATDIGFVVYHHGIAVNDFRYLAAGEPVLPRLGGPFLLALRPPDV